MVLTNTPICNFEETLKNFSLLDIDNKTLGTIIILIPAGILFFNFAFVIMNFDLVFLR